MSAVAEAPQASSLASVTRALIPLPVAWAVRASLCRELGTKRYRASALAKVTSVLDGASRVMPLSAA